MSKKKKLAEIKSKDLEGLSHKQIVSFAVYCAELVVYLNSAETKLAAENAIIVTKKWLAGEASAEERKRAADAAHAAANAAYAAAHDNAAYAAAHDNAACAGAHAAHAAANAAYAAAYAACAASAAYAAEDKQHILQKQHNYLYELKHIDKIFEEEVLGHEVPDTSEVQR